jgi:endonuclease/exonuclease/phosphatase family metal-dependent hydrolase
MAKLRFAFFNVENLFARASVLNVAARDFDPAVLDRLSSLRKELARESYAGHEESILRLFERLQPFIAINEERDNLLRRDRQGQVVGLVASGRADWDGSIRLKDARLNQQNRGNTAHTIASVAPDVLALAEVENRRVLQRFNEELLGRRYPYAMLIDGNDERGIDVGVLSRFPIDTVRTHVFDERDGRRIFHRDCLEVGIRLPSGAPLALLVSHFKSRRSGRAGEADADSLRRHEAERVAQIMQSYDLAKQLVLFCGDLNDTKERPPQALQALWNVGSAAEVFETKFPSLSQEELWTFYYAPDEQRQKIDFMFASSALLARMRDADIERRGMHDLRARSDGREQSFPSITRAEDAASDHGLLWADFDLA